MATANIDTRQKTVVTTEKFVSVELTMNEARILKGLIGCISNIQGEVSEFVFDLYAELGEASPGVHYVLTDAGERVVMNGGHAARVVAQKF